MKPNNTEFGFRGKMILNSEDYPRLVASVSPMEINLISIEGISEGMILNIGRVHHSSESASKSIMVEVMKIINDKRTLVQKIYQA